VCFRARDYWGKIPPPTCRRTWQTTVAGTLGQGLNEYCIVLYSFPVWCICPATPIQYPLLFYNPFSAWKYNEIRTACGKSCHFYRAMHFSAKRGIAIACRPSVCLSVRNVEVLNMNKLNKHNNQQKAIILYRHSLHCSCSGDRRESALK